MYKRETVVLVSELVNGKVRTRMITTVQVIFYSMYGRIHGLAEAIAQGAREVNDVQVELFRVPELISEDMLQQSGAKAKQQAYDHIPVIQIEQLANADAYLFGTPSRFGTVCAQMRHFFEQLSGSKLKQALAGKIGGLFTGMSMPHDQQAPLLTDLFRLGMLVAGTPQPTLELDSRLEGAASLSRGLPTETELEKARHQGRHIAQLARAVKWGKSA